MPDVHETKLFHEKSAIVCDSIERENHAKEVDTLWGAIHHTVPSDGSLWLIRAEYLDEVREDYWSTYYLTEALQLSDLLPDADTANGIDIRFGPSHNPLLMLIAHGDAHTDYCMPAKRKYECKLLSPAAAKRTQEYLDSHTESSGLYSLFNQFFSHDPEDFHDLRPCMEACEQALAECNYIHDAQLWFCG